MSYAVKVNTSAKFERELSATIFAGKAHWFDKVESTNSMALEAARQGAEEGTLFIADEQTAGRGRGGHSWHSAPGSGLYFSFVLRPQTTAQDALWLSLAAGAAVHVGVKEAAGVEADIRWPNDVLVGAKKFCGILTELQSDRDRVEFAVVGIGINVNHESFPSDLTDIATSLRIASGQELNRESVLVAVLRAFDAAYRPLRQSGVERPSGDLLQRLSVMSSWIRGKHVEVPEQGGYSGVTAGLDERGFLLVETETGLRTVMSGGVRSVE